MSLQPLPDGLGAESRALTSRSSRAVHTGGMSNQEMRPDELVCAEGEAVPGVEIIAPREVPLGGPRAMLVRRTLPSRQRS